MEWKDIGKRVINAAPMLGSLLGAPGAAAGVAVKLIASAFGLTEDETTPERIDQILTADPQAMIKLKELEYQNQQGLRDYYLKWEGMRLADVGSAREREVKVVQATGEKDYNLYVLAWTVVAGFFGLVYVLTFQTLPDANVGPVNQLYGVLGTGFGVVLGYFYGSSKSSRQKDTTIAGLQDK